MILVLCPLAAELDYLVAGLKKHLGPPQLGLADRLKLTMFGDLTLAVGGHGKVQFALSAGYLLERLRPSLFICAGAAGALNPELTSGTLIAATETIEHDFRLRFVQKPLPHFAGSARALACLQGLVLLGKVASGDEDIIARERAEELRARTQADAVAWEGAGAARAAKFYRTDFLELRAITDAADIMARENFVESLEAGMSGLAGVLLKLLDNYRL